MSIKPDLLFKIYFLLQSSESSDLSDGPITVQEFMEVKSALTASEAKIQQLLKVNCHLSEELRVMQNKVSYSLICAKNKFEQRNLNCLF